MKPRGYDFIQRRLAAVRETFEISDDRRKANLLYRAYLFAMISSSTRLANHELGFSKVIQAFPDVHTVRPIHMADIARLLQSSVVMYHGQKAAHIVQAAQIIPSLLDSFSLPDRELRELLAQQLPGVARTKASFTLMLLGRVGVACADTHFQKLISMVPGKSKGKYELMEDHISGLGMEPGVYQWSRWCEHMRVPIEDSHEIYFRNI